eukprot:3257995-Amphidinium_carterae.1
MGGCLFTVLRLCHSDAQSVTGSKSKTMRRWGDKTSSAKMPPWKVVTSQGERGSRTCVRVVSEVRFQGIATKTELCRAKT